MLTPMDTSNRVRNIVIASLVGTLLFMAALGGFLWWYLGSEEDAVREASNDLIAAIEDKDPGQAPADSADYVTGLPKYFGPIQDAKVVDARKVSRRNSTNSSSQVSWWTSTILLHSERGAALLLVTFDQSIDPKDAKIVSVRELSPGKVADGALSAEEARDVKAGFKSRGGETANAVELSGVLPEDSPSPSDLPGGRARAGPAGEARPGARQGRDRAQATRGPAPPPLRAERPGRHRQAEEVLGAVARPLSARALELLEPPLEPSRVGRSSARRGSPIRSP